jgi:hypothetical protein
VEGVNKVSPKERERRLAKQRIDRSYRIRDGRPRRLPPWTRGEKALLVLWLALLFAEVALAVVMLLLS